MECNMMVLPSSHPEKIRVLKLPPDMERQEAYRYATGVIAAAEECSPNCDWSDIEDALDEHGFEVMDFVLGPMLD